MSVAGKTVLITGGGNGVGAETARQLRARGANLVLTDVDRSALDGVVGELGAGHAIGIVADVTDLAAMESAVAAATERFGGVDVVVANAGIASYGSILNVDPASFYRLIDININGVFNTVRAALPSIIERRGYVLVVSSLAAFATGAGMAPYSASKAAVENFANTLRLEVTHLGVAVGSAHMSWIDTPLVRDTKSDLPSFGKMISRLPPPLSKTTSVDKCGRTFVKGIEKRKRRVYCPGWVGVLRVIKPLLSTAVAEASVGKDAATLIPESDAEIAALGRSVSARYVNDE